VVLDFGVVPRILPIPIYCAQRHTQGRLCIVRSSQSSSSRARDAAARPPVWRLCGTIGQPRRSPVALPFLGSTYSRRRIELSHSLGRRLCDTNVRPHCSPASLPYLGNTC